MSHAVPIYESYALHHTIRHVAGCDLTEYLMKIQGTLSLPPQTGRLVGMSCRKLCCIGVDFDTVLKSTDKEKTCDGNITVGAQRQKCCSSQVSPVKEPAESTSFLSKRSVTLTSARICTPMSCRQVARSCSRGPVSAMNCAEVLFQPMFIGKGPVDVTAFLFFR